VCPAEPPLPTRPGEKVGWARTPILAGRHALGPGAAAACRSRSTHGAMSDVAVRSLLASRPLMLKQQPDPGRRRLPSMAGPTGEHPRPDALVTRWPDLAHPLNRVDLGVSDVCRDQRTSPSPRSTSRKASSRGRRGRAPRDGSASSAARRRLHDVGCTTSARGRRGSPGRVDAAITPACRGKLPAPHSIGTRRRRMRQPPANGHDVSERPTRSATDSSRRCGPSVSRETGNGRRVRRR